MQWSKIFVFKQKILYINVSETEGKKASAEETSKKSKIILRFEIHKRMSSSINPKITIIEIYCTCLIQTLQLNIGNTHRNFQFLHAIIECQLAL